MQNQKVYTVQEAADFLKIRDYTLRGWLRDGKIRGFKAGTSWRIKHEELVKVVDEGAMMTGHPAMYDSFLAQAQVSSGRDFKAALYVLSSPLLAGRCRGYIRPGEIQFSQLVDASRAWSESERALVELAAALYNSTAWKADITETFYSLDRGNFEVALEALRIRFQHYQT